MLIVRHREREAQVRLERLASGYRVHVDEVAYDVDVVPAGGLMKSFLIEGRHYEVAVHPDGGAGRYWVGIAAGGAVVELMDPLTHLARGSHGGSTASSQRVTAYMPGRVVKVLVGAGDTVEAGQGLVILEAMKMENEIQAEVAGQVKKILVQAGQAVEGGDLLFEIG